MVAGKPLLACCVLGTLHLNPNAGHVMVNDHSFACFQSSSESNPSCFLAVLDIGKSDLTNLLCNICIRDYKLLVKGVLQQIIEHLNRSFVSSFVM